jgi:predicted ArsR family transcriptional regulator
MSTAKYLTVKEIAAKKGVSVQDVHKRLKRLIADDKVKVRRAFDSPFAPYQLTRKEADLILSG